jgi:thiol-disulfide isomerase/thioredoxin
MLGLLVLRGFSLSQFDDASFTRFVKNGNKTVPWFVMFGGLNCPACDRALPEFESASSLAQGFCRFGHVDTAAARKTSEFFQILTIPTFLLFTELDHQNYTGSQSAAGFVRFASEMIGDGLEDADPTWTERTDNYVILFTRQFKPPPAFSAVYGTMKRKGIAFGMARDSETIEEYGNPPLPSIWLSKNGQKKIYKGKLEFASLESSIAEFFGLGEGKPL